MRWQSFAPLTPLFVVFLLFGCTSIPEQKPPAKTPEACAPCTCPSCPPVEVVKPAARPHEPAKWTDLPAWSDADLASALGDFVRSCEIIGRKTLWRENCAAARPALASNLAGGDLRAWFESHFLPWQLVNGDGSREGLVTGYYEPVINGSRQRGAPYLLPLYGVPDDLVTVDLSELYPELKGLRLRGRIDGRKLVPYASRAEIARDAEARASQALLWVDDAIDLFFMEIQGSGQVQLDDGQRIRVGFADQNGYPYRSIGKWLVERGEMKIEQTSMQSIKAWAAANPQRLQELLNANPSVVFFRELPLQGSGPPGALGVPLTPERSIAVDSRTTPLGAPVWLATTYPGSERSLTRLMLAQDTGGAIRGPVRADFFWGSGSAAGEQAGRMHQSGRLWVLLPTDYTPGQAPK